MAATTPNPPAGLVPKPKLPESTPPKRGSAPIGMLLEKTRRRLGYSVESVCAALFLTDRELNHYESGVREPPPGDLERLAEFYGVDIERFRPGARAAIEHDAAARNSDILWLGWAGVELTGEGRRDNRAIVPRLAQTIRSIRALSETASITFRDDELAEIAGALDLEDDDLLALMILWFGLSASQSVALLARLRYTLASTKQLPEAGDVDVATRQGHPNP